MDAATTKFTAESGARLKNLWIGAYIGTAVIVPQCALLWRPIVGAYVTVAALVYLLVTALYSERARKLAISAAIVPVALLISLSLPQTDAFAQACVFYDAVLFLAFLYGFAITPDKPVHPLALLKQFLVALPGLVIIGAALGAIGYGVLRNGYGYHNIPVSLVAVAAVMFAVAEELLFRGLIQRQAAKLLHPAVAATLAVLAYASVYAVSGLVAPVVFACISGSVLSAVYYFKQNILLTITTNVVMKLTYLGLIATFVLH